MTIAEDNADAVLAGLKNQQLFEVVPSDTVKLSGFAPLLYVGGLGDVTVKNAKGDTVLFKAVPVGTVLPTPGITHVMSTGTTATFIVASGPTRFR